MASAIEDPEDLRNREENTAGAPDQQSLPRYDVETPVYDDSYQGALKNRVLERAGGAEESKDKSKNSHTTDKTKAENGSDQPNTAEKGTSNASKGGAATSKESPSSSPQKSGVRNWLANKYNNTSFAKKAIFAGFMSSTLGIVALLLLLFILASLLKIPNLSAEITEYEFARIIREFSLEADRTAEEAAAVESASTTPEAGEPDGLRGAIENEYKDTGTVSNDGSIMKKLDNLRPENVVKNLRNKLLGYNIDQHFDLNTHNIGPPDTKNPLLWGKPKLDSVTLDGTTYPVEQVGGLTKFVPILRDVQQFRNNVAFTKDFYPDLVKSLEADQVGPIARAFVENNIRKQLGIGLIAWNVAKFQNVDEKTATEELAKENFEAVDNPNVEASSVQEISDASNAAQEQTTNDVNQGGVTLDNIIQNGGVDKAAQQAIDNNISDSIFKDIVGFLSPAYAIGLPACLIYEGSLDKAGPTIDSQTAAQQSAFYLVASAADEQKSGAQGQADPTGQAEARAVGAMNNKLGDITNSNAYVRANGGTVNTLYSSISPEASPTGEFTLIDATPILGGSGVGNAIKGLADAVCPVLSNIWFGLGTGVLIQLASLFADIFTGGGASVGEEAVAAGADAAAEETATSLTERFVTAIAQKFEGKTIGDFAAKLREVVGSGVKSAAGLAALTIIAKIIVMMRSNTMFNGLEQGTDFANEADSGANINAGEAMRQQLFGRPLTCAEILQSNTSDKTYLAYMNEQKSFSDRYLAISNTDSLVSHAASMVYSEFGGSLSKPLGSVIDVLSGPISFGSIFRNFTGGVTFAAVPCSGIDYGNIQFGWSNNEETLINSNNSYLPLENQKLLDDSGKEDEIAQKYSQCFGYSYDSSGTTLDPTDPNSRLKSDITTDGSLGSLISGTSSNGPAIERDASGDIVDDPNFLCSPINLGPKNSQYGDLVFRWRLAMAHDTSIQQLTNENAVTQQ